MLKKRIITALVLIPLVVLIIFFAPPFLFAAISGALFIVAFSEWPKMAGYSQFPGVFEFVKALVFAVMLLCILGICFFIILYPLFYAENLFASFLSFHSMLIFLKSYAFWTSFLASLWLLPVIAVLLYPRGSQWYTKGYVSLGIGIIILSLAWFSLVLLQATDPRFALYPLILVWIADTGAYFVGKKYGRLSLAAKVSPKKTWEGVAGAVLGAGIISFGVYFLFNLAIPLFAWILLTTGVVLISVVGDLFESIFKRVHHLKDSGNMLPGHGGLLDRIDALLPALPVFAAGFLVLFGTLYYSEVPLPAALFFRK